MPKLRSFLMYLAKRRSGHSKRSPAFVYASNLTILLSYNTDLVCPSCLIQQQGMALLISSMRDRDANSHASQKSRPHGKKAEFETRK